ncbi:MAG: amino acid decarboxylase [Bacteroidetes bacterium]|nr:amino acid decarboxylase [Bacteroidota bacterium]MBU1679539.1 amino acid decarboxylase [Bacteroidota bacterium]MBU2506432.1 amino acid decarboxylase [Bacteroidota bacterium]
MKEFGDMPIEEFKKIGYEFIDWIAEYLQTISEKPVLSQVQPGDVKRKLPNEAPLDGEAFDKIFADLNQIIIPGMTHWNHPNFMAYFNSTASGPGILAELLSGAFNINGMLWKSCPSSAELEEVTLNWLKKMLGLDNGFWGIIYDTASTSTMHAIAAARESIDDYKIREKGLAGRDDIGSLRLYASEHAHSSIDKGAITVGVGLNGVRKIPVDSNFSMIPEKLREAILEDKSKGFKPFCVVATVGTTSSTSIDPVTEIAKICKEEDIWLHVDAAHAGTAAIVPEMKWLMDGCEFADSIVINPHKWMFVPIDLSVLFTKKRDVLRRAFSLEAEYLKTPHNADVTNYMDYGIQLGRRFRSLKLWFVIRYFGVNGLIDRIREHLRLGRLFSSWIEEDERFELLAPVPLSTTCFRAVPAFIKTEEELNIFNENLMNNINSTGRVFLSHTKLNGKYTIRLVVSGIRTEAKHVEEAWQIIQEEYQKLVR